MCGPTWYFSGHCRYASVWSVRSGDNVIYPGGTLHLLRLSDYPLPYEFEEVYQVSSELYFETDIASMSDLSTQAQMLQQLIYSDDRLLRTVLSDEAYTALSACLQEDCRVADRNAGEKSNQDFSLVPCRSLPFKVWALPLKK